MSAVPLDEYVTQREAARIFGISHTTMARLFAEGKLPLTRHRIGNGFRFKKAEVLEWKEINTERPWEMQFSQDDSLDE